MATMKAASAALVRKGQEVEFRFYGPKEELLHVVAVPVGPNHEIAAYVTGHEPHEGVEEPADLTTMFYSEPVTYGFLLVQQLNYISGLLTQVDTLRGKVQDLDGPTEGMKAAKAEARKAGFGLFDAVVAYQRALLNELYKVK